GIYTLFPYTTLFRSRGAQSMLWGADAIGGVINIITKKGEGKPTVSAFAEYGSFATLREGFQVSGANGPFDFSGSLNRWDTSSFSDRKSTRLNSSHVS